ncbi:hypothetical protein Bca4012_019999 [Brassica carinata]|uniref:Uncharacterized protein n=1 Tax=Brassica carinata TaxID=52824 RepID=A0A8X8BD78_BRACI|nr:hypothetical protein Bca52824_001592 [Brassica carinata]
MKLEKQREKDMKHEKDNADESGDGDSSERSSRVPFASLVSAELKNQLGGLEGRLAHVIEAQGIEGRIEASVVDSLGKFEGAIVKVVTDSVVGESGHLEGKFPTVAEQAATGSRKSSPVSVQPSQNGPPLSRSVNNLSGVAGNRIRDVLGDLGDSFSGDEARNEASPNKGTSTNSGLSLDDQDPNMEKQVAIYVQMSSDNYPIESPSFSLGLTQEGIPASGVDARPVVDVSADDDADQLNPEQRKSKRSRNPPPPPCLTTSNVMPRSLLVLTKPLNWRMYSRRQ